MNGAGFSITLGTPAEELKKAKKRKAVIREAEDNAAELCVQTEEALERTRSHRLLELQHWQGFNLELVKLKFFLGKLTTELVRLREARENS